MKKNAVLVVLAWTLWIRTETATSDSWAAAPGFHTSQRCNASIKEKLDTWRQFKDAVFSGNTVIFTSNGTMMSYFCLQENEDPRKRTGGGL